MPASFPTRELDPVASPALADETAAREAQDATLVSQVADLTDQINSAGVVDKTYRHQQMTPASVWAIQHDMDKRPSVDAFNSSGEPIIGVVEYVDDNNLNIDVGPATGGEANLN